MSTGYHHFFVDRMHRTNHIENKENYFIGGLVGDTYSDEKFKRKIEKICQKLAIKFGLSNYIYCWSPIHIKETIRRTPEQRYHTAIKKSENKTQKRIAKIKKQNLLFGEAYIREELEKLNARKEVLKNRYNQ